MIEMLQQNDQQLTNKNKIIAQMNKAVENSVYPVLKGIIQVNEGNQSATTVKASGTINKSVTKDQVVKAFTVVSELFFGHSPDKIKAAIGNLSKGKNLKILEEEMDQEEVNLLKEHAAYLETENQVLHCLNFHEKARNDVIQNELITNMVQNSSTNYFGQS
jgi:hypothetical protein